jgi:hypothetical protein
MKQHTTQAGDQFLLSHIMDATKWSQHNRRRQISLTRAFAYCGSIALVIIVFLAVLSVL